MDGDGHGAVGVVETGLDSVAVVDVDVYVEGAEVLFDEVIDGDHGVVEDAESGCAVVHCMVVHSSGGNEGVFDGAVEDEFGCEHCTTGG